MRVMLVLLILVFVYGDVMGSAQIGPISAKNAMLNLTLILLTLQFVMRRNFRFQLPALDFSLLLLMTYAAISMFVTSQIVHFPHYQLWPSLVDLKTNLVTWSICFFVFFYGTRTAKEAEGLTRVLLLAVSAANLITLANIAGIAHLGIDPMGDDDPTTWRVKGAFGHENETGAMIAALLPAYIAVVESRRGAVRLFWIGAMLVSTAVLFMTSSRGALVGILIGGIWGAYVCRKYLSFERALKWGTIALAIAVPIVAFVGIKYWDTLVSRFAGASSSDIDTLSSGRTEVWMDGLSTMLNRPSSLIVGYGWDTWALLPFRFVPHNQYLWLWFELGLVGVGCLIVAFRTSVVTALAAIKVADPESRRMLVGYVVGILILAVSIFFANLWIPWHYLWPYIALAMRSAYNILSVRQESATVLRQEQPAMAALPVPRGTRRAARERQRVSPRRHGA